MVIYWIGCVNIYNSLISKTVDSLFYGFIIFAELWFIIVFSKLFIKINEKYINIIFLISTIFSIVCSILIFEIDLNLQIIAYIFIIIILILTINKTKKNIFYIAFAYVLILFLQCLRSIVNNIIFMPLQCDDYFISIISLNLVEPILLFLLYRMFKKHKDEFQNTLIQNDEWNIYTVFACISICYMWTINYFYWEVW